MNELLNDFLKSKTFKVEFIKIDGSTRIMYASYVERKNTNTMIVYDLEIEEYRSINFSRIKRFVVDSKNYIL